MLRSKKFAFSLFLLASVAHLAIGWYFHALDFRFFPGAAVSPYLVVAISAIYALTGAASLTKFRVAAESLTTYVAFSCVMVVLGSSWFSWGLFELLPSLVVLLYLGIQHSEDDDSEEE